MRLGQRRWQTRPIRCGACGKLWRQRITTGSPERCPYCGGEPEETS